MEYNDFLISTPEEFEKIAKAYHSLLRNKNVFENLGKEILEILNSLSFIYETILKNSRNNRLSNLIKEVYFPLNEQQETLSNSFSVNLKNLSLSKPKNLFTLRLCIKLSIEKEADLVLKLIEFATLTPSPYANQYIEQHLKSIKTLTQII